MRIHKIVYVLMIVAVVSQAGARFAQASGTAPTVSITMSDTNLTVGETATVDFLFTEAPVNFTLSDVMATGGTLSNLTTVSAFEYQAVFTPTSNFVQSANSITVAPEVTMRNYVRPSDYPDSVAYDGTNIWAANYMPDGSIFKLAPDGTVTEYSGDGNYHEAIAFDGTNMWTANIFDNSVTKFSPSGVPTTYSNTGASPHALAFDGTNMWVANTNDDSVAKIGPTGTVTTYTSVGGGPRGIAFDGTNMWTANSQDNSVTKITLTGTKTTYTGTGSAPVGITFDGTNMWTVNGGDRSVTKITPSGSMTTYTGTDIQPISITFDGTNIWTGNYNNHTLTKVTLAGVMTTYAGLSGSPYSLLFDGANIWSANLGSNPGLTKIGTTSTTMSSSYSIDTRRHTSRPAPIVAPTATKTANGGDGVLDFVLNDGAKKTNSPIVTVHLNGDPSSVRGYAVSLDPNFTTGGIRAYTNVNQTDTFTLPDTEGTYTVYLEYFSTTGMKSSVIQKDITYTKKVVTKSSVKRKRVLKK
ncbi:MAG: Ig-like domain-containing protein [bacterium]